MISEKLGNLAYSNIQNCKTLIPLSIEEKMEVQPTTNTQKSQLESMDELGKVMS